MGKLFCILGKSGSGKNAVFRALLGDGRLGLHPVVLYTTRPSRAGEREGVDYHFVTASALLKLAREGKILERRRYHTVHGIWQYATVDDGQFDTAQSLLMIATLEAFSALRQRFGADNIVPLYLEVEDGLRLSRALERERTQKTPDYAELCRRFLADRDDFSDEKLEAAGVKTRYINDSLEDCVHKIKVTIERRAG